MTSVVKSTWMVDHTHGAARCMPAEWSWDPSRPLLVMLRLTPFGLPETTHLLSRSLLSEAVHADPPRRVVSGAVALQRGDSYLTVHMPGVLLVSCLVQARTFLTSTYRVCAPCVCVELGPQWCRECSLVAAEVEADLAELGRAA